MQKKSQEKNENNNIKEKLEDIKLNIEEKSETIKKDITKKTKELKKDIKEATEDIKDKAEELIQNVKDSSKKFDKKDVQLNKAMACLAYVLPPVAYFLDNKSNWVKYHAIQGMNLFIIFIILSLIVSVINSCIIWPFTFLKALLRAGLNIFAITYALIGIINVCNEKAKELPIINKIKFIKK